MCFIIIYGFSKIVVMYQTVLYVEQNYCVIDIIVCRTLLRLQHDLCVERSFCILKTVEGRTPLPCIKHDYVLNTVIALQTLLYVENYRVSNKFLV